MVITEYHNWHWKSSYHSPPNLLLFYLYFIILISQSHIYILKNFMIFISLSHRNVKQMYFNPVYVLKDLFSKQRFITSAKIFLHSFLSGFNDGCIEVHLFLPLFWCSVFLHQPALALHYCQIFVWWETHYNALICSTSVTSIYFAFCIWGFVVIFSLDPQLRFTNMAWLH